MYYRIILTVLIIGSCYAISKDKHYNCTYRESEFTYEFSHDKYPHSGDLPLLNRKMVNAHRTSVIEHPYLASVRRLTAHFLTATMINEYYVLTVAHPLIGVPINELSVVAGETYNDRGTDLWTVILIIVHTHFDRYTLTADIALLRTYEPFNPKVSIKPLPKQNILNSKYTIIQDTEVNGFVTGWGRCVPQHGDVCLPRSTIYHPHEFQDPMMKTVTLNVLNLECLQYQQHGTPLQQGVVCVGKAREEFHATPCLGVPGAPLMVGAKLLGVLSWGFGCGYHHDLPLVYTDVRFYATWIESQIETLDVDPYNFTHLFHATRALSVLRWFKQARDHIPAYHTHKDLKLHRWELDKFLVRVNGTVYDVRDFASNGIYHNDKVCMFESIKNKKQTDDDCLKRTKN